MQLSAWNAHWSDENTASPYKAWSWVVLPLASRQTNRWQKPKLSTKCTLPCASIRFPVITPKLKRNSIYLTFLVWVKNATCGMNLFTHEFVDWWMILRRAEFQYWRHSHLALFWQFSVNSSVFVPPLHDSVMCPKWGLRLCPPKPKAGDFNIQRDSFSVFCQSSQKKETKQSSSFSKRRGRKCRSHQDLRTSHLSSQNTVGRLYSFCPAIQSCWPLQQGFVIVHPRHQNSWTKERRKPLGCLSICPETELKSDLRVHTSTQQA